jgi:hypothetical protein
MVSHPVLALVANFMVFHILQNFLLTTQGSPWFAGSSLTGVLLMAVLAFYAFSTSLGADLFSEVPCSTSKLRSTARHGAPNPGPYHRRLQKRTGLGPHPPYEKSPFWSLFRDYVRRSELRRSRNVARASLWGLLWGPKPWIIEANSCTSLYRSSFRIASCLCFGVGCT